MLPGPWIIAHIFSSTATCVSHFEPHSVQTDELVFSIVSYQGKTCIMYVGSDHEVQKYVVHFGSISLLSKPWSPSAFWETVLYRKTHSASTMNG